MEIITCFFTFALIVLNSFLTLSSSKTIIFNFTTDKHALLAFKNTISDGVLTQNWSTNTSVCYWIGVSCGPKHQRVTALNVSGLELKGTIAPHLGNLTFLRTLDISSNNFTGPIPPELSKLRRLKVINLESNQLTGSIPYGMFNNILSLVKINMKDNRLSGKLPSDLFNTSTNLKTMYIYLSMNQLDGQIPANICKCRQLEELDLEYNQLQGGIPSFIFNISSLRYLDLSSNSLFGSIPTDTLYNLPEIEELYLSNISLTEYGSEGKVSTNGDVYSYRIMLLEMFTRKRPTDDMFGAEMSLKEWVSENGVIEVVAPGLLSREDQHFSAHEQCVSSVFDLAMKCLAFSPDERINMIQVVTALHKIKSKLIAATEVIIMRRP